MERWDSPNPLRPRELFREMEKPWWFSGGWALELYLGQTMREHSDLEVGCFRSDTDLLLAQLDGWDLQVAQYGKLHPYGAHLLTDSSVHTIWCRPSVNEA